MHLLDLLTVPIAQALLKANIEIEWQLVLLVDLVQHHHLLLELDILRVIVLHDRSKGATGEGKGDHSHEHHYNAEDSLQRSLDINIAVAHCRNCSYNEVEGR